MIFDSKKYKFRTYLSDNIYRDQNNFLVCEGCTMGRTGVQRYGANELDLKDKSGIIEVHRLEKDVFDEESLQSLEGRPFTVGHVYEKGGVTIENYKKYSKGQVFGIHREDNNIVGNIRICDEETAKLVEKRELRELSLGYRQKLCYDEDNDMYSFTDIIYNHLALVKKGRAGNAMICDEEMEETMENETQVVEETTEVLDETTPIVEDTSEKEDVKEDESDVKKEEKEEKIVEQKEEKIEENDKSEANDSETLVKEEIKEEGEIKMDNIIKDTAYFLEKQKEIASLPESEAKKMLAKALENEMKAFINDQAPKEAEIVVEQNINDSDDEEEIYNGHDDKMQAFFDSFDHHNYSSEKEYEEAIRQNCVCEPTSKLARKSRLQK